MLRISCPFCGPRDEVEFHCGGEAHLVRPNVEVNDKVWADYLFNRKNTKGIHLERWCHVFGCGQWFNVARNTVNHEILAQYEMSQSPPEIQE